MSTTSKADDMLDEDEEAEAWSRLLRPDDAVCENQSEIFTAKSSTGGARVDPMASEANGILFGDSEFYNRMCRPERKDGQQDLVSWLRSRTEVFLVPLFNLQIYHNHPNGRQRLCWSSLPSLVSLSPSTDARSR